MTKLNRGQATEFEPHHFVVDASSIGLPPGSWPSMIETDIGNGRPLVRSLMKRNGDGEIFCVRYIQDLGCIWVEVLND